jgi:hypothetical protein
VIEVASLKKANPRLRFRSTTAKPVDWNTPFQVMVETLLRDSKRLGADYVFMIDEKVVAKTSLLVTEPLDMLVLPIFIMPSRKVEVLTEVSGVLMDTQTGDVILQVNDRSQAKGYTAGAYKGGKRATLASKQQIHLNGNVVGSLVATIRDAANTPVTANAVRP